MIIVLFSRVFGWQKCLNINKVPVQEPHKCEFLSSFLWDTSLSHEELYLQISQMARAKERQMEENRLNRRADILTRVSWEGRLSDLEFSARSAHRVDEPLPWHVPASLRLSAPPFRLTASVTWGQDPRHQQTYWPLLWNSLNKTTHDKGNQQHVSSLRTLESWSSGPWTLPLHHGDLSFKSSLFIFSLWKECEHQWATLPGLRES